MSEVPLYGCVPVVTGRRQDDAQSEQVVRQDTLRYLQWFRYPHEGPDVVDGPGRGSSSSLLLSSLELGDSKVYEP